METTPESKALVDRRRFLQGISAAAAVIGASRAQAVAESVSQVVGLPDQTKSPEAAGPGAVAVKLNINGQSVDYTIEPRVTLLDALRNYNTITGAKEGCDRATCGACSVLMDGKLVYACMVLAIDAQGHEIITVEGLAKDGKLTTVQKEFVACDALMCGYCTPGFVMAVTALLQTNPKPTADEVKTACSGNLCRCGTYPHIVRAALRASGVEMPGTTLVDTKMV